MNYKNELLGRGYATVNDIYSTREINQILTAIVFYEEYYYLSKEPKLLTD